MPSSYEVLAVKLTREDKERMTRVAAQEGLKPSTWLRRLALLTLSAKSPSQPEEFPHTAA